MAYNFGAKFFLASQEHSFRPKISAYYGINSVLEMPATRPSYSYDEYNYKSGTSSKVNASARWRSSSLDGNYKSYEGVTLGFGAEVMFGQSKANGLDFDIMYIATEGYADDMKALEDAGYAMTSTGRIKIAIGYRHAF
jgi:hypothetical protein